MSVGPKYPPEVPSEKTRKTPEASCQTENKLQIVHVSRPHYQKVKSLYFFLKHVSGMRVHSRRNLYRWRFPWLLGISRCFSREKPLGHTCAKSFIVQTEVIVSVLISFLVFLFMNLDGLSGLQKCKFWPIFIILTLWTHSYMGVAKTRDIPNWK